MRRHLRIFLGIYQIVLVAICTLWLVMLIRCTLAGESELYRDNIFFSSLIVIPTIPLCLFNVVQLRFPRFLRGYRLDFASYIFMVLSTILFVFVTVHDSRSCTGKSIVENDNGLRIGDQSPAFSALDQHGNTIALTDFKGKYILLDFWATWCPPCVRQLPEIRVIHEQFQDQGLVVIGVNLDYQLETFQEFLQANKMPYSQLFDEGSKISTGYGIKTIPCAVLIDGSGVIVERITNGGKQLKDAILRRLN